MKGKGFKTGYFQHVYRHTLRTWEEKLSRIRLYLSVSEHRKGNKIPLSMGIGVLGSRLFFEQPPVQGVFTIPDFQEIDACRQV